MRLRICKWSEFQHYKDRNPPWIKLHYAMLSSRTWVNLNDTGRVLAIASMLIASKEDGEFDADHDYFKRVAYLNTKPDWQPLIKSGFCEVLQADASIPEHLQEDASSEKRQSRSEKRRGEIGYTPEFESFWKAYPKKTNKGPAFVEWLEMKPPLDACLAALEWQVKSDDWTKENGKYVVDPERYIKRRKWEDEPREKLVKEGVYVGGFKEGFFINEQP